MSYDAILQHYADAVYNKDVEQFLSIYDEHVYIYDTWNQWMCHDLEALRNMTVDWFESLGKETVRVEFTQLNVIDSVDHTIWIGEVNYKALDEHSHVIRSICNRMTWVIKACDGGFRIVHEHSSLPINIESFSGMIK